MTLSLTSLGSAAVLFVVLRARWWSSVRHFDRQALQQLKRSEQRKLNRLKKRRERQIEKLSARAQARVEQDEARAEDLAAQEERYQVLSTRLNERESQQLEREAEIKTRRKESQDLQQLVKSKKKQLKREERAITEQLESRAQLSSQEVINAQIESRCAQIEVEMQQRAQRVIVEAEAYRESRAAELMSLSRQRYYDPQPAERLISYVELPQSKRLHSALTHESGEWLTLLREVTQVEFVLDAQHEKRLMLRNSPETYTRELARLTFQRWLSTGQLTEQALRKQYERAATSLDREAREAGKAAAHHLGLKGIHPEILALVGKLLFRTSYTQNQWQHAIEASELCGMMAAELNMDVNLARRATLLHDIGKVLWAETEAAGSHAVSGAVFAREHGEIPEIVHPIGAHHHDELPASPLAYLVIAADTLSGARPGARRETSEAFSQHVAQLDQLCGELSGIKQHMVIQGGRELRLNVAPHLYSDLALAELTEEVAAEIEEQCVFPGQIKVTGLREVIHSSVARARLRDQRHAAGRSLTHQRHTHPLESSARQIGWGGERGWMNTRAMGSQG
jgi:ribonuclease Y